MLNKEQVLGMPGVFVIIAAFRLATIWENVDAPRRSLAADEFTNVLTQSARQVVTDIYLSRSLKSEFDYFLRVHAFDLAEAQSYLEECGATTIGRHSQVTESMIGLIKPRQYITPEKSAELDERVNATTYEGESPRFAIVIPVKKTAQWWTMPESERRSEIETHTRKSIPYLS